MAYYKDTKYVTQYGGDMFEPIHNPGVSAPYAGIYRCEGCGHEIGIAQGHTLPPEHNNHTAATLIRWRLIVWAVHKYT